MVIDAYGHVSLPRQMSADAFLRVMDENKVDQALICTAETCPDLAELSRAACRYSDRLRVAGLPVGSTPQERVEGLRAQMDSGFIGARLQAQVVAREPQLLDVIGEAGGIAIMVGGDAYRSCADLLVEFLDRYHGSQVWGAHFGEPNPSTSVEPVPALFEHPRFAMICSRHGGQSRSILEPWARLLVERLGWDRLLFGSEYPVAAWRNELYAETMNWMERFSPTAEQKRAYLGGNAERMLFSRPAPAGRPLDPRWANFTPDPSAKVQLFLNTTFDIPESLHQKLLQKYLAQPQATRGRYGDYLIKLLSREVD